MRFLIDAQLPRRLADWLSARGYVAAHTLDLPDANRTTDQQLIEIADREHWVAITKDSDFVDSHLLRGRPARLLLISTGNIRNLDLEALIESQIKNIASELETNSFLELGRTGLVIRG